jgi:hypothetical protein
MSRTINLVDGVVSLLNMGDFSFDFVAERRVLPVFDIKTLSALQVSVLPSSVVLEMESRSSFIETREVMIGIQKKVNTDEVESLIGLAEEIADHIWEQPLEEYPPARFSELRIDPIYDSTHLDKFDVYTSVIHVQYKIVVEE